MLYSHIDSHIAAMAFPIIGDEVRVRLHKDTNSMQIRKWSDSLWHTLPQLIVPFTSLRPICFAYRVEPLLKDSPNKGHHRNYLPTKDTL